MDAMNSIEAATERRQMQARVPLDDVLVEVTPEGFDESFEADGVNVCAGGLSMRAAILPDIGSQLSCRFRSPVDGETVFANCEVVWAQDAGPNIGEVGLRFTELDDDDAGRLRELVDHWEAQFASVMNALETSESGEKSMDGARKLSSITPASDGILAPAERETVQMQLDGVRQPIEAELVQRVPGALIVEQPLSFIQVGTGVSADGRVGTLEDVALRIEDNTPRLVLTITYEESSSDVVAELQAEEAATDTLMDTDVGALASQFGGDDSLSGVTRNPTPVDAELPSTEALNSDASSTAPPVSEHMSLLHDEQERLREDIPKVIRYDVAQEEEELAEASESLADDSLEASPPAGASLVEASDVSEEESDPDASLMLALKPSPGEHLKRVGTKAKSLLVRAKTGINGLGGKAAPGLRSAWVKTRHTLGTLLRQSKAAFGAMIKNFRKGDAKPSTKARSSKRRTTRAPAERGAARDERPRPRRKVGRYVLLALIVIGAASIFFSSGSPALVLQEKAEKEVVFAAQTFVDSPYASGDPEAGDTGARIAEPEIAEIEIPEPAHDVEPSGGPLPEPSFPTVGDAPSPGETPVDSPYAVEPQPLSSSIGSEIDNGREFRIRLGGAPRGLRREESETGLRVVVDGARAEEGARRIATVHPRVERASIRNDGETAVLQLNFIGEELPFHVRVSGGALFITLPRS